MKHNVMTKEEMRRETFIHNISRVLLGMALLVAPLTTFASTTNNLNDLVTLAVRYFNQAIYVIIAIAVVVFVWNIYNYFFKADVENKKDAGLYVMYSVIGFFIIISFWGLVNILSNTFNLNTAVPTLNFFGSSFSASGGSATSFVNTASAPTTSSNPSNTGNFSPGGGSFGGGGAGGNFSPSNPSNTGNFSPGGNAGYGGGGAGGSF